MQTAKTAYFRVYVTFVLAASAYSLTQVMNTHQQGWLGVLLTTLPATAFFIRLFTDKMPRTESKLTPLHLLAAAGVVVTAISQPSIEQLAFSLSGLVGLLIYDFWANQSTQRSSN